jgi:hypothetical protein
MKKRGKRFVLSTVAVLIASAIAGGIAWAQWSASGTGQGGGAAVVAKNLVVSAVTPSGSGASLYPGGPAGWVYLTIQNPNPWPVTVTNLNWGTPTSTSTSTCPNSQISLDANAPTTGFSINIPANTTTGSIQVFSVLDLAHTAPDGCQGVVFLVPVTAIGVQQ